MAYGNLKVDNLVYSTPTGDITFPVSGIVYLGAPLISGVSGVFTTVYAPLVSGGSGVFLSGVTSPIISGVSGIFTTSVSGATVTGGSLLGTTITGTSISGANITGVSGTFTDRISGATITGGNFNGVSGVFTTSVSGATVQGNTVVVNSGNFASGLLTSGTIQSTTGGFKFPDGTTQTTAATAGVSLGLVIALGG